MIPDTESKTDLYNMVTIKNPLNEDFIFGYDNKGKVLVQVAPDGTKQRSPNPDYDERGNYMIKAGETRNFPKFIVITAMKHLIDKILLKKDDSGKYINNQSERDKVANLIFVKEEQFDRPLVPTDMQIVDQMNVASSDLERVLQKNTEGLKVVGPVEATPEVDNTEQFDGLKGGTSGSPAIGTSETTEGTETATGLPSREKMVAYAKAKISIDPETIMKVKGPNEGKTIAKIWEAMTDQELYTELQIGEGDIT